MYLLPTQTSLKAFTQSCRVQALQLHHPEVAGRVVGRATVSDEMPKHSIAPELVTQQKPATVVGHGEASANAELDYWSHLHDSEAEATYKAPPTSHPPCHSTVSPLPRPSVMLPLLSGKPMHSCLAAVCSLAPRATRPRRAQ